MTLLNIQRRQTPNPAQAATDLTLKIPRYNTSTHKLSVSRVTQRCIYSSASTWGKYTSAGGGIEEPSVSNRHSSCGDLPGRQSVTVHHDMYSKVCWHAWTAQRDKALTTLLVPVTLSSCEVSPGYRQPAPNDSRQATGEARLPVLQ